MAARKLTGDALVDELMAQFDYAFSLALPQFQRMQRIANSYGNVINTVQWPTISEISIPLTFISVEEQLTFAMEYLMPSNAWIKLFPAVAMDFDRVKLVEDDLRYTLLTEMKIRDCVHLSLKDCYRYAVGYGLIDTEWVYPEERRINELISGGEAIEQIPQLGVGEPVQQVVYEYISPICVIPMPGGANVDKPNKAPSHFVIRTKSESELRDMFAKAEAAGQPLKGDVEKIIKEARSLKFDARMTHGEIIAAISNIDFAKLNDGDEKIPVIIPIIHYFGDHQQVKIANGTTIIHEETNKYQMLRSDLIKWSAWPDGNNWFPMGVTEASERLTWGVNVWYNGLIDLAMYHMNPSRVINTNLVDTNGRVSRGPRSDIMASGDATKAVSYMTLPEFPQQLFVMGDTLQNFLGQANAQPASVRNGQAGMVRGGTNALETLLSSTTGRQFLAAVACKTGGLLPTVEKTLIKKQLIADKEGRPYVTEEYDAVTGKPRFTEHTVTLEDLRRIYRVELNLPAARMNSAAAFAEKAGFFDRAQRNLELFDQRALYEELTNDYALVRRTMLPDSVVRERQDRMAEASLQGRAQAPQELGPSTQGDQALAGAAALSGEL